MSFLSASAVVLRSRGLGESDRIVTLITREAGLISAVARGAAKSRKRFGGVLLTGSHVAVQVFLKRKTTLHRLDGADLIEPYAELSDDPLRFAAASHLLELSGGFAVAHQGDSRQFALLTSTLRALCSHGPQERLLRIFELRTLLYAGHAPNLNTCAACGRPVPAETHAFFSIAAGSVVCGKCRAETDAPRIAPGTRRLMDEVLASEARLLPRLKFTAADLAATRKLLPLFCEYVLDRRLHSLRQLNRLSAEKTGTLYKKNFTG